MKDTGILFKYSDLINLPKHSIQIGLGEGDTPFISLPNIVKELGGDFELYVKYEGLNPTGSFKDRGMVSAISEVLGRGVKTVVCASTGNTAASAAAYASRYGLKCIVLIPEGKIARGKLVASSMYGAQIVQIKGNFDDALKLVKELTEKDESIGLVNSINPYRLQGQKTSAFEICDELGQAPDILCLPVGNAGNITAYNLGFEEYDNLKQTGVPKFIGVQAEGASPLVKDEIVENPETIATAIRIGNPARFDEAKKVVKKTNGKFISVSDDEILEAQKNLAKEGIWAEPASASSLAGFLKEVHGGLGVKGKKIVLIATGNGLKDPDIVEMSKPVVIEPNLEELQNAIL